MFKRFVSLTLLWSFLVLFVSSVVLFIEPHGRVAFWADWHFLGLTKTQWDDLHLCSGTLFSLAALVHLWLNWAVVVAYLKKRLKDRPPLPAVAGSVAITLFVCLGAYYQLPPMKQLMSVQDRIKRAQARRLGNPPFGHAELVPIGKLAKFLGIRPDRFVQALKGSGLRNVDSKDSLKRLSVESGKSPSELFGLAMAALERGKEDAPRLPSVPPPGTGMMTIEELARTYHVDEKVLTERLKKAGIDARADQSLKEIAGMAGMSPPEIYAILAGPDS